jgi:vacuolar protein sorting-associated protein 13A/C
MAYKEISLGISGIVTEPYEGAKKNGFKGGAIGMGKGIVGFIFRPLKGGYFFLAHFIVGLGNTPFYIMNKLKKKKI